MRRLLILVLLAATAVAAGCKREQARSDQNAAEGPAVNRPVVPRPAPPLDRASLLAAIAEAASATAAGAELPESVQSLDGRQFEMRIRFGCAGPATDLRERPLGWSFDSESRRIRVRAMPTISKNQPLVEQLSDGDFEAVEGFWILRPWLLQPICPASAAIRGKANTAERERESQPAANVADPGESADDQLDQPMPGPPRFGIAQFFTKEDPRTRRRGMRPYEAGHKLDEGKAISSQGFNLVLSGRLRALPGRGVILCLARNANSPPECVVSAEFLRVWIEQPDSGDVVAEWGAG
jgi:hypothetical protein